MSLIKRATCYSKVVTFTALYKCSCGHNESGNAESGERLCPICGKIMQVASATCDCGEDDSGKEKCLCGEDCGCKK